MNVFMFHFGRCGSTVLTDSIKQIPGFAWHGEIFSPGTFVYEGFENTIWQQKKGFGNFTTDELVGYIKEGKNGFIEKNNPDCFHYGCEIKSYHFEYKMFNFSLEEAIIKLKKDFPEAKFIFLHRENSLRRIISALIAKQTNIYHVCKDNTDIKQTRIDLEHLEDMDLNKLGNIVDVLSNSATKEKYYSHIIKNYGGFVITYEDYIYPGIDKAMKLLSSKLNVPLINPIVRYGKTNPASLMKIVVNIDELKEKLNDTVFKTFLD